MVSRGAWDIGAYDVQTCECCGRYTVRSANRHIIIAAYIIIAMEPGALEPKSLGQVHTTHSRTQIGIPLTNTMEGTLQPILRLTTAHTTSTTTRPSALTPVASQGSTRAQTRGTLDAPSLGFNRLQRKSCTPLRKGRRGRQQAVQTGLWESGRFPARRRRSRSVLRVLVIQCRSSRETLV